MTTTATITTATGNVWRMTAELAAVTDHDRTVIQRAIDTFVWTVMMGERGYEVEVTVPDHPALAELA